MYFPLLGKRNRENSGFTLIEVLVAIAIMGVALSAATSAILTYMRANYSGELIFEGAQAAQSVIDFLRYEEVESLPASGTDPVRTISINNLRDYDVYVTYCADPTYCTSNSVRQLVLRVEHDGTKVYETETIFTQLEKGTGASSSSSSTGSSSSSSSSSTSSSSTSSSSTSSSSTSSSSTSSSSSSSSTSSSSSSSSSSSGGGGRRKKCRHWGC